MSGRPKNAVVRVVCILAPTLWSAFAPANAWALDPEITSDTAAQFYEMRSPTGETVISRRRLTTTLGASVYDLLDTAENPKGPQLSFRIRLRYDADYRGNSDETNVSNYGRLVPGFDRGPVDVMYGYLEGRRFLDGWLGFRLGRQYITDALGWWSFDGGLVKITSPYYISAEVYGGLEQRGGLPLSLPRYERDGVWRGDRNGYDPSEWSSFQPNAIAPAYGFAIESTGFTWLHGRFTYRRVLNTGESSVSPFLNGFNQPIVYDGTRLSQERFGYSMDASLADVGGVKAGLAYDMFLTKFANVYASVDAYLSKRFTLSLDYDYYVPTFDADSIWNFFLAQPMNDLALRANWDATDKLSVSGALRGRVYKLQTGPEATQEPSSPNGLALQNYYPSHALNPQGGGDLAARYRTGQGVIGVRGSADFADSSDRVGMDLYGERTVETRYVFQARTGVWQWNDSLRPDRDAVSVQYVLGAGYKVLPRSLVLADFEHDINRLAGQRFRVMLWLSLAVAK